MGDVGDYWRDTKKSREDDSKNRRASNRENSANILAQRGIGFVSKNGGAHLIVDHNDKILDFWPGTGKWICRGGKSGRGVFGMIKYLERKPA